MGEVTSYTKEAIDARFQNAGLALEWEGTYDAETEYNVDDVVEYRGSTFIATLGGLLPAPSDPPLEVTTVVGPAGPRDGESLVIYAKDYGVVADGITYDDEALAAAYAALKNGTGTILQLPRGDIRIADEMFQINLSGWIRGHGIGLTRFLCDNPSGATLGAIDFNYCENLRVSDFTIYDVNGDGPASGSAGIGILYSDFITVERVEIVNCAAAGINLFNVHFGLISQCIVRDGKSDGLHTQTGSKYVRILDNIISNNGDDGIVTSSDGTPPADRGGTGLCENIIMSRNVVINGGSHGIVTYGGRDILITDNEVNGSVISAIAALSGSVYNEAGLIGCIIANNIITRSGMTNGPFEWLGSGAAILVQASSGGTPPPIDRVLVTGNIVRGQNRSLYCSVGNPNVSLTAVGSVSIIGNDFDGVLMDGDATHGDDGIHGGIAIQQARVARVRDNRVVGARGASILVTGIPGGDIDIVEISGNLCQDSNVRNQEDRSAIMVYRGESITITDNTVWGGTELVGSIALLADAVSSGAFLRNNRLDGLPLISCFEDAVVPSYISAPAANAQNHGKLVLVGDVGIADALRICVRAADGTYLWKTVVTS